MQQRMRLCISSSTLFLLYLRPCILQPNGPVENQVLRLRIRIDAKISQPLELKPLPGAAPGDWLELGIPITSSECGFRLSVKSPPSATSLGFSR